MVMNDQNFGNFLMRKVLDGTGFTPSSEKEVEFESEVHKITLKAFTVVERLHDRLGTMKTFGKKPAPHVTDAPLPIIEEDPGEGESSSETASGNGSPKNNDVELSQSVDGGIMPSLLRAVEMEISCTDASGSSVGEKRPGEVLDEANPELSEDAVAGDGNAPYPFRKRRNTGGSQKPPSRVSKPPSRA
jgi:hypothetical protein